VALAELDEQTAAGRDSYLTDRPATQAKGEVPIQQYHAPVGAGRKRAISAVGHSQTRR